MIPQQVIATKRDGGKLAPGEFALFLTAYLKGQVGDEQMAAFLMAVQFNGLSARELDVLVKVMLHSGRVLQPGGDWPPYAGAPGAPGDWRVFGGDAPTTTQADASCEFWDEVGYDGRGLLERMLERHDSATQ